MLSSTKPYTIGSAECCYPAVTSVMGSALYPASEGRLQKRPRNPLFWVGFKKKLRGLRDFPDKLSSVCVRTNALLVNTWDSLICPHTRHENAVVCFCDSVRLYVIEACEKCHFETEISVKGIVKLNRFIFTVRNSYDGFLNTDLGTTKHDKSYHGYGIEALKGIVAKYNGAVYFENNEKKFTTFISIPLQ